MKLQKKITIDKQPKRIGYKMLQNKTTTTNKQNITIAILGRTERKLNPDSL